MIDYNEEKAINYSLLKEYYHSLPRAKAAWERMQEPRSITTKPHFLLGTLVDMYITEPDKIESSFLVMNENPPTDSYAALADEYLRIKYNLEELFPDAEVDANTAILSARENVGFQSGWKPDTVIKNFWEKCSEYILIVDQAKRQGKSLCTQEVLDRGRDFATQLTTGHYTYKYFSDKYIVFNQVEVFWSLAGIKFKSKLDRVLIDVEAKQIILVDIKTYGEDFLYNYYEYSYWLQDILYKAPFEFVKSNTNTLFDFDDFEIHINEPNEQLLDYIKSSTYVLNPGFVFLTVSTGDTIVPAPYVSYRGALSSMNNFSMIRKDTNESISFEGWWNKSTELWKHIQSGDWKTPIDLTNQGFIAL